MAGQRSEFEDKHLKKNAFSDRCLKLELGKLKVQEDSISKRFRHEKSVLQREIAEGENIVKWKLLKPEDIRPLSKNDGKKLSPRFNRKMSCNLPLIVDKKCTQSTNNQGKFMKHRLSLPTTTTVHYDEPMTNASNHTRLLERRRSADVAKFEICSTKINKFLQKLQQESSDRDVNNV